MTKCDSSIDWNIVNRSIELTVGRHSNVDTFLISALLTLVSCQLIDDAFFTPFAVVTQFLLNSSPKETLKGKEQRNVNFLSVRIFCIVSKTCHTNVRNLDLNTSYTV